MKMKAKGSRAFVSKASIYLFIYLFWVWIIFDIFQHFFFYFLSKHKFWLNLIKKLKSKKGYLINSYLTPIIINEKDYFSQSSRVEDYAV